ncbi:MAG: LysR substrate-binding domain-containing protein [Rhodobacterales bacterium]|nr:LysR substrate-binding domain-containing protein [Rhodobacterales bacterium]
MTDPRPAPSLPPLNALRAFEVAARCGSFVMAAAELGVTAAAVSQQVKSLETRLGKRLFERQGNRIVMTDAGRALYPRLESAFADLAAATDDLTDAPVRHRLVISVLPALAEHWLIPRLKGLTLDPAIEIRMEEDPVNLVRDGIDLRLTYGAHFYPDHKIEVLFRDEVTAVAAPSFPGRETRLSDQPDSAFVHTGWGPSFGTQPGWSQWFAGRDPDATWGGLTVHHVGLALAAARAGLGVALVPERLAASDLAQGRLFRLEDRSLPLRWDFVLVHSHALRRRPALQRLITHLLS